MPSQDEGMSSVELSRKLDDLIKQQEAFVQNQERLSVERHALNNKTQRLYSVMTERLDGAQQLASGALRQISDLHTKYEFMTEHIQAIEKHVTALDHLIRGVDGKNGLRGEIAAIRAEQVESSKRLRHIELRFAGIVAMMVGAGLGAAKLISLF